MKHYDIAVIGAGSGGLVVATSAMRRGARVAMIENNKIGGDCTHSGCVPSKTLVHSAKTFQAMKGAATLGLPQVDVAHRLDFARVMEHVDDVVQSVYAHETPDVFQDMGIDVYVNALGAQFLDARHVRVGEETIGADYTVIATGSLPREANKVGTGPLEYLNNENFWRLREMPDSTTFLGGGVIAAELGQALAFLGSEVTIIDRNPRIIKATDEEVGALASRILQEQGIRLITDTEVVACEGRVGGQVKVYLERQDGGTAEMMTERIFVAMGRTPTVAGLALEAVGVAYDTRRGIITNEYLQTSAANIYACGDVTTPAKFTHTASYQADICVENIPEGNHAVNDLRALPWVIFTEPEIAHVGMSEAEARAALPNVQVFRVDTASVDRFVTESATRGFLKVVMDEHDVVVGADAIGAHSGEWMQLITLAVTHRMPVRAIADTIFAYPVFSEIAKKAFTRFLRTTM